MSTAFQLMIKSKVRKLVFQKNPLRQTLNDVSKLYSLLPGSDRSKSLDFGGMPPDKAVDYTRDIPSVRKDMLLSAFLKKSPAFRGGNPKKAAIEQFLANEEHCRQSNITLRQLRNGTFLDPSLNAILLIAQRKIARVLGNFRLDDLLTLSRWGPGTTSSCRGSNLGNAAKFAARPEVSGSFLSRARLLLPLLPSWSALLTDQDTPFIGNPMFEVIKGNRVTFVPKTSKIHRPIAIEPHINVFFQAGLGRMIRKGMKARAGVDLSNQTLNQRLAKYASIHNDIATVDLESASDLLCTELVRDLLPEDWFDWLNAARSHSGTLEGKPFVYEKFSSMGNGATFDLESLIFWALASAVCEQLGYNTFWVNVFGDDIVVPSGIMDELTRVFNLVGFKLNLAKTFFDSPYRESCGKDYVKGVPVRPVYVKNVPSTEVEWAIIANQLRKLSHEWGDYKSCHRSLKPAYDFCLSRCKSLHAYRVPYGLSLEKNDRGYAGNGLIANFDEATPSVAGDGWDGFYISGLSFKTLTIETNSRSLLVAGSFIPSQQGNEAPLRDRVEPREVYLVVPSNWYNLGPWAD